MGLSCELCGSTNFVKDQGMFVCQGCGCRYTLEEAREIMARANQGGYSQPNSANAQPMYAAQGGSVMPTANPAYAAQAVPVMPVATPVYAAPVMSVSESMYGAPALHVGSDFNQMAAGRLQGAQAVNNYACQGWQLLLGEYEQREHPNRRQLDQLGERAREIVVLLDNAARLEPENHVQNLLILQNCKEVARSAHMADYYDKDEEGHWRSHSFALDVDLPGQSRSWDELIEFHRSFLEQRYIEGHPDERMEREALLAQRENVEARLAELKSEKRSKGFFNFSEKREVKERMRPVQDELKQINRQISAIDNNVDDYVEKRLSELETGYIRLDL